jgi:predicted nucleic acid-binding protein
LAKPEVAGAINGLTDDADAVREAAEMAFVPASTVHVDLDQRLAGKAVELAIGFGLRGADAVYAATARRFDAILVTLDGEQRTRLPSDITVLWPWEVEAG